MTTAEVKDQATKAVQRQSQSNQVVKTKDKVQEVKAMLQEMKPQLKASLVKQVNPEYIISTALTAIRQNPTLLECSAVSLIGAVLQSNQLGLRLDGPLGHAYMVPYRNTKKGFMEAQFMVGYRGYMDLARRSGEIAVISAGIVYEKDGFDFEHGLNERLVHKPLIYGDRGPVTHVYAYAKLKNGSFLFNVMRTSDVEKIRTRSKAKDSGPWVTDWDEMAKKSAIRPLSKYLPMSVEFAKAVELDELAARGIEQSIQVDQETGDLVHATYEEEAEAPAQSAPAQEPAKAPDPAPTEAPAGDAREPEAGQPSEEFGVRHTQDLLKAIQGAVDIKTLDAVAQNVIRSKGAGDITEAQSKTLGLAYNAKHKQLLPVAPTKNDGGR